MDELLSVRLSPRVGRIRKLTELQAALAPAWVVTVVGPSGAGMTRLALAAAALRAEGCAKPPAHTESLH
jgi:ABC-type uncharacterized transport system YnjBCD ATPase subunit